MRLGRLYISRRIGGGDYDFAWRSPGGGFRWAIYWRAEDKGMLLRVSPHLAGIPVPTTRLRLLTPLGCLRVATRPKQGRTVPVGTRPRLLIVPPPNARRGRIGDA
jgi:hypothetical protein